MNSRIGRNIAIVVKAERLIARRHLAAMRRRTILTVVAAIFGAIGLVMLNVAALYALWPLFGPAISAAAVAGGNLVLALILLLVAGSSSVERELEVVTEVRDTALADLEGELEQTAWEIRDLSAAVHRLVRDPLTAAGAGLLGPLLSLLLKNLRK